MTGAGTTASVHFRRGPIGPSKIRPDPLESDMRKRLGVLVSVAAVAAGITLFGGTSWAGPPDGSPIVGHTYVNDNAAVTNPIAAFDRHADGSLTPIPGSPFL